MEFKYTEITLCLMLGLMCVINGGHVVERFDRFALKHGKVFCLLKTLLDQVVHPLEYFHSAIILCTYQYYNKTKCMFEPRTHYCHI